MPNVNKLNLILKCCKLLHENLNAVVTLLIDAFVFPCAVPQGQDKQAWNLWFTCTSSHVHNRATEITHMGCYKSTVGWTKNLGAYGVSHHEGDVQP